jgi:hypothetical protein
MILLIILQLFQILFNFNSPFHFLEFVATDVTTDPLYYNQLTPNSIWPSRMYSMTSNIPSKSVCSAMCTLTSVDCQIYVYVSNSLTCYLGNFATVSAIAAPVSASEVVNTRISAISKFDVKSKEKRFRVLHIFGPA